MYIRNEGSFMKANFDEISIQYWLDNRKYIQAKSYSCFHNGYVYGDNMQFDKINFVFVADDNEINLKFSQKLLSMTLQPDKKTVPEYRMKTVQSLFRTKNIMLQII